MSMKFTLKVTSLIILFTRKCDLRLLAFQLFQDLDVGDIALLIVLTNHQSTLVTDAAFSR
jgi:hypothetical protein